MSPNINGVALARAPEDGLEPLFHVFLPSTFTSATSTPLVINEILPPLIVSLLSSTLPNDSATLHSFLEWERLQCNLDAGPCNSALEALEDGHTLPFYIHEQNSALLITKQEMDKLTMSHFRLSLPAEKVTSELNTFAMTFPNYSVTVNKSHLLPSKSLIRQLSDLNEVDLRESVATVKKSNTEVIEKRETAEPIFVSRWLMAVLSHEGARQSRSNEFPKICKKMRDSIRFYNGHVRRRSPMWVFIKATLQLLLVKELGKEVGTFVYKIILIRFMVDLLRGLQQPLPNATIIEYISKISRRAFKLDQISVENLPTWVEDLHKTTLDKTLVTLKVQHDNMKSSVKKLKDDTIKLSEFSLSYIKLWIKLTMPHNNFHDLMAETTTKRMFDRVGKIQPPFQLFGLRHRDPRELMEIALFDTPVDLNLLLFDFEENVNNWQYMISECDSNYVWTMFQKYYKVAKEFYKQDILAYSRFIFTLIKIIQVWDNVCCSHFPSLIQHRTGVGFKMLQDLLLTNRKDLTYFNLLEGYFERRDQKALFPSLIEEIVPSINSFANRFAQSNSVFQEVRLHLLEWGKVQVAKKLEQVRDMRQKCERLKSEERRLECEYIIDNWKRKHNPTCEKCRLNRLERKMVCTVYEAPLPVGNELQNAVVFELIVPDQIAVLRDLLFLFHREVMDCSESIDLHGPWHDYQQIRTCTRRKRNYIVSLMSEKKLFMDTHYRELHPTNPDSDFILNNGYNTVYASSKSFVTQNGPGLKQRLTFKVEKKSRYSSMQYGINGDVTQNEVIARQNECHQDLGLTEFIDFSSMRSVPNLQWRNLFRSLNSGHLQLKEESVFHLVCQVIWNVGPSAKEFKYLRANQLDFNCKEFCEQFLTLLDKIRESSSDNWKDSLNLLTIIYISQAVVQLNPAVERRGFNLTKLCSKDAVRWSEEVQRILKSLTEAPRSEVDALRVKLIEVNCCIALTFNLDELCLYDVMAEKGFIEYLLALARIHDNLVLLGDYRIKPSLKNLLNRVDELAVHLEKFLKSDIKCSSELLTSFVERHHTGSRVWKMRTQQNMEWKCNDDDGQVYFCEIGPLNGTFGNISTIQMDIIKGKFLVDGSPVGYLPTSIEKHRDFEKAFGNMSFEVTSYAFQIGRLITKEKFGSSNYSFYLTEDVLKITEHRVNEEVLEYVNEEKFYSNIPSLLIENYSHWYNPKAKRFEFFEKRKKLKTSDPAYILHSQEDQKKEYHLSLYKFPNKSKVVIDINCPDFQAIINVIGRLEISRYIYIWCDTGGHNYVYTVEMPRMGLTFSIRNVAGEHCRFRRLGDLVSKEWRGMRVSTEQGALGTLIGIKSGLLLEDADVNSNAKMNAILIIPHGLPYVQNNSVHIDLNEVRSPPFFAYEVDMRLKQLKAGDSRAAVLYLAYLHALTNHCIADFFTGISGSEMALQLLQSGQCFSSEPLDDESLRTLEMIKDLSPVREFYHKDVTTMEVTNYHDVPLRCALDAYILVVDQIIQDSERLNFLYPEWKGYNFGDTRFREMDLTWKAYWNRHYYSNELSRLKIDYLQDEPETITYVDGNGVDEITQNTFFLSQDLQNWTCSKSFQKDTLKNLLLNGRDLKGILTDEKFPIKEGVYTWSRLDFRDYWLDLYNIARKVKRKGIKAEWAFLMTYFMFRKDFTTIEQLNFLQIIAVNQELFRGIDPPEYELYTSTDETNFDKQEVKKVLMTYKRPWEAYLDRNVAEMKDWETELEFAERMKPIQESLVSEQCDAIADAIEKHWPIGNLDLLPLVELAHRSELDLIKALEELSLRVKSWYRNRALFDFITTVEQTVASIKIPLRAKPDINSFKRLFKHDDRYVLEEFCETPKLTVDFLSIWKEFKRSDESTLEQAKRIFHVDTSKYKEKARLFVDEKVPEFPLVLEDDDPIMTEYMQDLKSSWVIYHKETKKASELAKHSQNSGKTPAENITIISNDLRKNKQLCAEFWEKIREVFFPHGKDAIDIIDNILIYSEIYPRITPITMLKLLPQSPESGFQTDLRDLIGAYAVLLTQVQKSSRLLRFAKSQKSSHSDVLELTQELANNGHENWSPAQRPEWLLFEIESDLMIRPIQAKVAERMENPIDNENALLQLNMGEGKSMVIVPLLTLSLANGNKLCRVTVLRSLFQINKTYLSFRIGSIILDRRVYCFPCRRDHVIKVPQAKLLKEIYEECRDLKGVVLTLPEYRLSFELKAYERIHCEYYEEARAIFGVQEWLKKHERNLLDESDELLHVKYQLIYTLGKQFPVGGGSLRWGLVQDILSVVPEELQKLQNEWKDGFVELKPRTNAFPFCRILKTDCGQSFINNLAVRILNKRTPIRIPGADKKSLYDPIFDFFTKEKLSREELNIILQSFSESTQEMLLIIRGLLACGVLVSCLTKRWRVNFGVSLENYRRMAVPFRAKDVASDRVEFGHPDVAILLTQLSYFYSGLNNDQLEHCFVLLYLEPNPAQEYLKWVGLIPEDTKEKVRIKFLASVNLNDFFQKTEILFPLLKFNRNVINFFLSRVVFPHESKQFGWKISCTPWDMTSSSSGFSGTNDSKILLPSTIKQRDLMELKGTNGGVLAAVLQQGDNYEVLDKVTAVNILMKLVDSNMRILLDVGALMLELDNEQAARKWLELLEEKSFIEVDAAVYFDANDKLVVLDRTNTITSFELSTFRNRLERTVIYLDEVHTRGTDLKIPVGNTACVTLGKGVGKDKLVQGCMRMRKLGKGHHIKFWASPEVNGEISAFHTGPITSKEVLLWSIKNNQQQIKDGFIHWSSAGVLQSQKLSSLKIYKDSPQKDKDIILLGEHLAQKEQISLEHMFGNVRNIVEFPVIVDHMLKRVNRELAKLFSRKNNLKVDCTSIVEEFGKCVVDHVKKYVPKMMRSTQLLDEEQERELEHELQAECQKQLPTKAKAMEHVASNQVLKFITTGSLHEIEKWAIKLPLTFKNTSIWRSYSSDTWGKNIYTTYDFYNTTSSAGRLSDDYLRMVEWFAVAQSEEKTVIVLLSNFEAGLYIDKFRSNGTKTTLHMYNSLKNEGQSSLHDNKALTLPMKKIEFDKSFDAPLTLYSGGLFFKSATEEEEYAWYLCYCLGKIEEKILESGGNAGGWIKKEFWPLVDVSQIFPECPEGLVREILRCRWGVKRMGVETGVGRVILGSSGF